MDSYALSRRRTLKKKLIAVLIQIIIVALVLALTVTTYAWYVSQTSVAVNKTSVTAAAGAGVSIISEEEGDYEDYMGQTGLGYVGDDSGGVDAPYTVTKTVEVQFMPLSDSSKLVVSITSVRVEMLSGKVITSSGGNVDVGDDGDDGDDSLVVDGSIVNNFTWRINYGGEVYGPDKNGFACRSVYDEETGKTSLSYIEISSSDTVSFYFTLIFLDEENYAHWEKGEYGVMKSSFAYCGYEYMKSVFQCVYEIGLDVLA